MKRSCLKSGKKGFTLVELLVVISIITVLAMLGMWNYRQDNSAQTLQSARDMLASTINQARLVSLADQRRSRVLILSDAQAGELRYRVVVLVVEQMDADGNFTGWSPLTKQILLPRNTYLSPDKSHRKSSGSPVPLEEMTYAASGGLTQNWWFIEFSRSGLLAVNQPNFVFELGRFNVGSAQWVPRDMDSSMGFVVQKLGGTYDL